MAGQQRVPDLEGNGAGLVLAQGGQELAAVEGGQQPRIGAAEAAQLLCNRRGPVGVRAYSLGWAAVRAMARR